MYIQDPKALSFVRSNVRGHRNLYVGEAIENKRSWLFQQKYKIPLDSYDIAVTLTS